MEDIAPGLLEKIQRTFRENYESDEEIKELLEKLREHMAKHPEAYDYAEKVGEILADAYTHILSGEVLPEGKMWYNIGDRVITPTLEENYKYISDYVSEVQAQLNQMAGIGIKPIVPPENKDRVKGIIDRLSSENDFDKIAWILQEPIKTIARSIVDDSIEANAEFHGKAGMQPKIIRKSSGKCCEWCSKVEGTYHYPDVPKDVYRRHERCRCTVEYDPGSGKRRNIHTGQIENKKEVENRKTIGVLTPEEEYALKFKRTFQEVPQNQVVNVMRKDAREWIKSLSEEEIRCIQKYTLNEGDKRPKFYERLNAMLRGETPEDERLRYYAEIISSALKRSELSNNLIAYRGIKSNPFKNYQIGEYLSFNQFTSSSVKNNAAFKYSVQMKIYASKGSKGVAYIEEISKMPKQKEILFDKDCVYRVLSNSKGLIEVEVI